MIKSVAEKFAQDVNTKVYGMHNSQPAHQTTEDNTTDYLPPYASCCSYG